MSTKCAKQIELSKMDSYNSAIKFSPVDWTLCIKGLSFVEGLS